jgi:hypothetical protein
MKVDGRFEVLDPKQNYRGLSLGNWVVQLVNWMVSEDPVKQDGPVLFTKGSGEPNNNILEIYYREGNDGLVIDPDQAVLLQIISSTADSHFYPHLSTDAALRTEVREDIAGTSFDSIYADYSVDGGKKWKPVLAARNFQDYIAETPLFRLEVPKTTGYQARIWDDVKLEDEFKADAVTVGVFLLLANFEPSKKRINEDNPFGFYKFRFGAVGDGTYYTSSVYDIFVNDRRPTHVCGLRTQAASRPVFKDHPVWGNKPSSPRPLPK